MLGFPAIHSHYFFFFLFGEKRETIGRERKYWGIDCLILQAISLEVKINKSTRCKDSSSTYSEMLRFIGVRDNVFCFVLMGSSCFHCFSPRVSLYLFSCSKDRLTKYNLQRKNKFLIPQPPAAPWLPAPCLAINITADLSSSVSFHNSNQPSIFSSFSSSALGSGVVCSSECPLLSYTACLPLRDGRAVSR